MTFISGLSKSWPRLTGQLIQEEQTNAVIAGGEAESGGVSV